MRRFKDFLKENLTLQYHSSLNPRVWDGEHLKDEARKMMLAAAHDWLKFAGVAESDVIDIVFTGSNTNYNWTKYSDMDVHIVGPGLSDEKWRPLRTEWAAKNTGLKFGGMPLELYSQDPTEKFPSDQGTYSLLQDKWLTRPTHLGWVDALYDPHIQAKVAHYIWLIQGLTFNRDKDGIEALKLKFRNGRRAGLERAGEFSSENMLYKELRNLGYIQKLNDTLKSLETPS